MPAGRFRNPQNVIGRLQIDTAPDGGASLAVRHLHIGGGHITADNVHVAENITVVNEESAQSVQCTICGKWNLKHDTFKCKRCKIDNLCANHQSRYYYWCERCVIAYEQEKDRKRQNPVMLIGCSIVIVFAIVVGLCVVPVALFNERRRAAPEKEALEAGEKGGKEAQKAKEKAEEDAKKAKEALHAEKRYGGYYAAKAKALAYRNEVLNKRNMKYRDVDHDGGITSERLNKNAKGKEFWVFEGQITIEVDGKELTSTWTVSPQFVPSAGETGLWRCKDVNISDPK
jgi:hypothetical protein